MYRLKRLNYSAEEYAKRLIAAAEAIGIKGRKLLCIARLAKQTMYLVGSEKRGSDPKALATAALYWIQLLDYLRGYSKPPQPDTLWKTTGSSRASFYRAISIWAKKLLKLPNSHPLLKLRITMPIRRARLADIKTNQYSLLVEADCYNIVDIVGETNTCTKVDVVTIVDKSLGTQANYISNYWDTVGENSFSHTTSLVERWKT